MDSPPLFSYANCLLFRCNSVLEELFFFRCVRIVVVHNRTTEPTRPTTMPQILRFHFAYLYIERTILTNVFKGTLTYDYVLGKYNFGKVRTSAKRILVDVFHRVREDNRRKTVYRTTIVTARDDVTVFELLLVVTDAESVRPLLSFPARLSPICLNPRSRLTRSPVSVAAMARGSFCSLLRPIPIFPF